MTDAGQAQRGRPATPGSTCDCSQPMESDRRARSSGGLGALELTVVSLAAILGAPTRHGRTMRMRAPRTRGGWLGVVPGAAAASLLAILSFTSLCLCSDDSIIAQPFADGCGLAAQRRAELTADGAPTDDPCLGPCVDVRVPTAGASGDDRSPTTAPGLAPAPSWPTRNTSHLSLLRSRPRDSRRTTEHLGYTILRC